MVRKLRKASYDVFFDTVVNVRTSVAKPFSPSPQEVEEIIEKAILKMRKQFDEKINKGAVYALELWSTGRGRREKYHNETVADWSMDYIPRYKNDNIEKDKFKKEGWELSKEDKENDTSWWKKIFKHKDKEYICTITNDTSNKNGWLLYVDYDKETTVGFMEISRFSQVERFIEFINS